MAIKSLSVRKKYQTLAWQRSMSSTKKATEHPRTYSLSAMAATAATAVEATAATVVEVAITAAVATAATVVEVAITAAVASAFSLAAAVAVEVAAEAIGAGSTACGPGALMVTAISPAHVSDFGKCAASN
jgi:hypothetical protein